MKILETENLDKNKWNAFVIENKGEFLQSWEWGDFQESTGKKVWRLMAVDDNGEILGVALLIKHKMSLGRNYLYCPKGPLAKTPNFKTQIPIRQPADQNPNSKLLELLFGEIRSIAQKEGSVFLRIEPGEEISLDSLGNGVSKYSASNIQPKDTLILDLTKSEDQLLAEMKQKTRYNIRLAEKHGVKIRISDKNTFESDFEKFWTLTKDTTSRDGFQSHPKDYYWKMIRALSESSGANNSSAKIFLAEHEGKILAANIVVFFGARAVYLHGASSSENRNLMAPYLLQWGQIKKALQLGFKEYDFWGIDPRGEKNWGGITKFKIGFGGREVNYPQAIDLVYQQVAYELIKLGKRISSLARK